MSLSTPRASMGQVHPEPGDFPKIGRAPISEAVRSVASGSATLGLETGKAYFISKAGGGGLACQARGSFRPQMKPQFIRGVSLVGNQTFV